MPPLRSYRVQHSIPAKLMESLTRTQKKRSLLIIMMLAPIAFEYVLATAGGLRTATTAAHPTDAGEFSASSSRRGASASLRRRRSVDSRFGLREPIIPSTEPVYDFERPREVAGAAGGPMLEHVDGGTSSFASPADSVPGIEYRSDTVQARTL